MILIWVQILYHTVHLIIFWVILRLIFWDIFNQMLNIAANIFIQMLNIAANIFIQMLNILSYHDYWFSFSMMYPHSVCVRHPVDK